MSANKTFDTVQEQQDHNEAVAELYQQIQILESVTSRVRQLYSSLGGLNRGYNGDIRMASLEEQAYSLRTLFYKHEISPTRKG